MNEKHDEGSRTLTVERSTSTGHRLNEYDGVCGNIHGHNIRWEVTVGISMDGTGSDNMPLDLKDISSVIDDVDHALVLSEDDPLLDTLPGNVPPVQDETHVEVNAVPLGKVFIFDGDPTCEVMAKWMANRIADLDPVTVADVTAYETEKYGINARASGRE